MNKILYMLIGPKGAGKTYIGKLLARETDTRFLPVEKIWLSLNPGEDGWQKVESAIDEEFLECDRLIVEHLGAGDAFSRYWINLQAKYSIKMIRVYCDPGICLERVRTRNRDNHISVSSDQIRKYNTIAADVSFDWSLEINNNGPATDNEILEAFREITIP